MAPRDLSTQKWLLSTVSKLPVMMSLPGWWYIRTPGPITSEPSLLSVLMTLRIAIICPFVDQACPPLAANRQYWQFARKAACCPRLSQRGGRGLRRVRQGLRDQGYRRVVMGGRHEPGLVGRGRQVDASIQHR